MCFTRSSYHLTLLFLILSSECPVHTVWCAGFTLGARVQGILPLKSKQNQFAQAFHKTQNTHYQNIEHGTTFFPIIAPTIIGVLFLLSQQSDNDLWFFFNKREIRHASYLFTVIFTGVECLEESQFLLLLTSQHLPFLNLSRNCNYKLLSPEDFPIAGSLK